jgi:NADPH-dependent curcumin reductase CurA
MSGSGLALAKGDAASTLPAICMAISTTQCAYSGVYTTGTWTQGQQLYVSTATAGALTATAPSSGFLQKFGVAATSNSVLVIPAITIVGL